MVQIELPRKICIAESKMEGAERGVFATSRIEARECIERCPVIALSNQKDRDRLRRTGLVNYYFLWGKGRDHAAICLGWGSIYNHSFSPNAYYVKDMEALRMDFFALRTIEEGEEITVNYNGVATDTRPLRIPGIPEAAGGAPQPSSRILAGLLRRGKLMVRKLSLRSVTED